MTTSLESYVLCVLSSRCRDNLIRLYCGIADLLRSESLSVMVVDVPRDKCTAQEAEEDDEGAKGDKGLIEREFRSHGIEYSQLSLATDDLLNADVDTNLRWQYQKHPLWSLVSGSVVRHCDWDHRPAAEYIPTDTELNVVREYLLSAARHISAFKKLFETRHPRSVVVFNGFFFEEQAACEVARKAGIRVLMTEGSPFKDRRLFIPIQSDGAIRESLRMKVPTAYKTNAKRTSRVRQFFTKVYAGGKNRIRQIPREGVGTPENIVLPPAKRYALFLSQVPYDTVVTYDETVDGVPQVLDEVIDFFRKRPEWHLVIRLHPKACESSLHRDTLGARLANHEFKAHFTVVKGQEASTYDLMDRCALGITISSQSGLEMLGKARPVVVLGDAFYRGNGVTIDRQRGETIAALLERGLVTRAEAGCRCRTNAVLAYWLFRHLHRYRRKYGVFPQGSAERIVKIVAGEE